MMVEHVLTLMSVQLITVVAKGSVSIFLQGISVLVRVHCWLKMVIIVFQTHVKIMIVIVMKSVIQIMMGLITVRVKRDMLKIASIFVRILTNAKSQTGANMDAQIPTVDMNVIAQMGDISERINERVEFDVIDVIWQLRTKNVTVSHTRFVHQKLIHVKMKFEFITASSTFLNGANKHLRVIIIIFKIRHHFYCKKIPNWRSNAIRVPKIPFVDVAVRDHTATGQRSHV